jgi:hypothetical protein
VYTRSEKGKGVNYMGNIDTATRDYIRDKSVFADAFNFYVYGGEQVIKPEMLRQIDTAEIGIFEENENLKFLQRFRDGLNLCSMMQDENAAYLILGLEGQSEVHYAMPVKNMGYDYLRYNEQLESIARKHRNERNEGNKESVQNEESEQNDGSEQKEESVQNDGREKNEGKRQNEREKVIPETTVGMKEKKLSSGEFLSGFYRDDRLIPVITLVIFFSPDRWDGPRSLHDMFEIQDERVLRYVPDYRINLIEPYGHSEEELENMQSSLREVLLFIKYSNDKLKLKKLVQENENYSRMDKKAARLLRVTTNFEIKDNIEDGKEEAVNMCKALVDLMEDAREEGRAEARDEMCKGLADMMEDAREEGRAEARDEMCKGLADMMEDAREEGRAEMQSAMAEERLEIARKLVIRGGFTSAEIADLSGVDEETVMNLM